MIRYGVDTTFIYALCEPDTGAVRYVGKANDPQRRLHRHVCNPKGRNHRICWIKGLKKRGLSPKLEVLLEVSKTDWKFWECDMIAMFREVGADLVNGTNGGDGGQIHNPSDEQRRRQSERMKGNTCWVGQEPPNKGRKFSEEWRKNLSKAHKGKGLGNKSHTGIKASEETRLKMRASQSARRAKENAKSQLTNLHSLHTPS